MGYYITSFSYLALYHAFNRVNAPVFVLFYSDIPLGNGQAKLTESERDKIDNDALEYMKLCKERLSKYKPIGT